MKTPDGHRHHCVVTAGLLVIGLCAAPQIRAQSAAFEVASVKVSPPGSAGLTSFSPPGAPRFTATNVTMEVLIELAFGVEEMQISGGPNWLDTERYDIAAKPEGEGSLPNEKLKPLLRQLLAQRFKLATHRGTKEFPGYALVVAKGGPKLKEAAGASDQRYILRGGVRGQNVSMGWLAAVLARPTGHPVVDQTGIRGNYDIKLDYAPDDSEISAAGPALPSIFTALQEQLGLQLKTQKVPVEMLLIDHVERFPTEN
jgi:uncharacterized protein (TIGR03435 family)